MASSLPAFESLTASRNWKSRREAGVIRTIGGGLCGDALPKTWAQSRRFALHDYEAGKPKWKSRIARTDPVINHTFTLPELSSAHLSAGPTSSK